MTQGDNKIAANGFYHFVTAFHAGFFYRDQDLSCYRLFPEPVPQDVTGGRCPSRLRGRGFKIVRFEIFCRELQREPERKIVPRILRDRRPILAPARGGW